MSDLKTIVCTILSLATYCVAGTDRLPAFNWDTVPRYIHVRKVTAFTTDEIEYLATFPLVTFEKTTGMKEFGSTEAGTLRAAEAVKRVNPRTKILYYRNILVHYAMYEADVALDAIPNPFLADQSDNVNLVRQRVPAYDLSNRKVQSWWMENAKRVCSSKYIDGLFVDGNIKVLEASYLRKEVGEKKKAKVRNAYFQMMEKLPQTLGPDKLVLANIIRARFDDAGLEYLNYFDGSYIEGFEHAVGGMSREDYVAKGIEAIQKAARAGKIIAFAISMGKYTDTDMDDEKQMQEIRDFAGLQERFTYSLALFLICAEKYSYFMAHDGYEVDSGRSKLWMKDIPEYIRPLGPPNGAAIRKGYVYRREFENANVCIDIQHESANIVWK